MRSLPAAPAADIATFACRNQWLGLQLLPLHALSLQCDCDTVASLCGLMLEFVLASAVIILNLDRYSEV